MKSRAGRLTDAERDELHSTPILIGGEDGGGVLVVGAAMTPEQWETTYCHARHPTTREGWAERTREILGDDARTVSDADSSSTEEGGR